MCDELTEAENAAWVRDKGLNRRQFGGLGATAAALTLLPACTMARETDTAQGAVMGTAMATASRTVMIATPDGKADAFFVYPTKGKHAAIIMWPDIAGLRDAYMTMGTRLASAGFAVLVVNQYYRSARAPILNSLMEWRTPEGSAKLKPMISAITAKGTTSDAGAFVTWLDGQVEVDTKKKIGTCGYCMGGPFTVRTAFANPARVGAAASFHGGGLVGTEPDSPNRLLAETKAAYLFAIAQNDDERAPDDKDALRAAAAAAGRPAEIEVYPAQHGWCTLDAPIYDRAQAEKAWGRMLALFAANL